MSTPHPQSAATQSGVPQSEGTQSGAAQSEAAPAPSGPDDGGPARRARSRRSAGTRRRLANVVGLIGALLLTGALYSTLAPANAAPADPQAASAAQAAGRALYQSSCISCHGSNLQGVPNRGPSLIGVGEAAVYFQVSTGRMPLVRPEADAPQKPTVFSEEEIAQLMAYVQANGGGPTLPAGDLRSGELAQGGELFRLNCASCHNFVGQGGALSSGKAAPGLNDVNDQQIYAAMLTGPENMPVFGDNQLTPEEKRSIINYVQTIQGSGNPGGAGIGRIGPVAEGLVAWVVGVAALMFGIFWMGSKA